MISEQQIYAKILQYFSIIIFTLLIFTYAIYATGLISPYIAPDELTRLLVGEDNLEHVPPHVGKYSELAGHCEVLLFIPLLLLALCTLFCFIAITPILIRKKDIPYLIIAVLEIILLVIVSTEYFYNML